jgi:formate/nitrite transporter FocA (FNT family)
MTSPPIDADEEKDVEERVRPKPVIIYEAIRREGEDELGRSVSSLAWSGLAAGLSMTLALVAMGAFGAFVPDVTWKPLIVDLGYPLGYLVVILGRQQLFTENTLTPILPILSQPSFGKFLVVARLWAIVLVANIAGALVGSALVAFAHPLSPAAEAAMVDFGTKTMLHTPLARFAQAVFAGWLIALMVWLLPLAETAGPFIIFAITYVVGIAEFAHIIAGSVEVFYGMWTGHIAWSEYPAFFVPTFLGNALGGVAFVALLAFAQIVSDRPVSRKQKTSKPKQKG